jgi:hypothetical protein
MAHYSIDKICNAVRSVMKKGKKYLKLKDDEIEVRIEVLENTLEKLEGDLLIRDMIADILINTLLRYRSAKSYTDYWKKELESRKELARNSIETLRKLGETYPYIGDNIGYGFYFWDEDSLKKIHELEEFIANRWNIVETVLAQHGQQLTGKGNRKPTLRSFLLPHQCEIDLWLQRLSFKAQARYEVIANLFYGAGLEKRDSASELSKRIPQMCKHLRESSPFWDMILQDPK